jgi:hypothetical protein
MNLAWHDAVAEVGLVFDKAERSAGWAKSFTLWQAAALQRPWRIGDPGGKAACQALHQAMRDACKAGELTHTTTSRTEKREWAKSIEVRWESVYYRGVPGERRTVRGVKDVEIQTHHVTASDFSAWLTRNDISLSKHVTAWCRASGVTSSNHEQAATTSREPVEKRNARWLAEVDLEERTGPKTGAQARAIRRLTASEGIKAATVKKGIQTARAARAAKFRDGGVTALPTKKRRPQNPYLAGLVRNT